MSFPKSHTCIGHFAGASRPLSTKSENLSLRLKRGVTAKAQRRTFLFFCASFGKSYERVLPPPGRRGREARDEGTGTCNRFRIPPSPAASRHALPEGEGLATNSLPIREIDWLPLCRAMPLW